ncbi:hypothetical protein IPG36_06460 [bacterium]|nr:MAG: hypothetical protein IPG36_06460 [bacterium]
MATGTSTKTDPWQLKTPPLSSEYQMYYGDKDGQPVIVCVVGSTTLYYQRRAVEDLHAMLKSHGGWYGLKKGLRGRFGMYMPPLLEALDLAEVEHNARGNRMRAK